jgi:hypothetical protein
MIIKRIEVKDAKEIKDKGKSELSILAFFLSLPWCCLTPAALSLLGFFGAAGASRLFLKEILFPLFLVSFLLLGRGNYLSFYRKQGSRISRVVVLVFTILALALWVFRFGLIPI